MSNTPEKQKPEKQKNRQTKPHESVDKEVTFKIPDIGTGRYLTTATRILMDLMTEDTKAEKLSVLNSVIKHLGIAPEDFNRLRRNYQRRVKLDYDHDETYSWQQE